MSRCPEQIKEVLTMKNANGRRGSACSTINRTSPEIPMEQLTLISHMVGAARVNQRMMDGYINATAMCKATGKKLSHYLENKRTKAFLERLSVVAGIPATELILIFQSGRSDMQRHLGYTTR